MNIQRDDVSKISMGYRVLCFFICLCSLISFAGVLTFGLSESYFFGGIGIFICAVLFLVSFKIAMTGFPPNILLWTLGRKQNNK